MGIRKHAGVARRAALPVAVLVTLAACSSDSITAVNGGIDTDAVASAATAVSNVVNQPAVVSLLAGLDGMASVGTLNRIPAAVGSSARLAAVPSLSLQGGSPFTVRATRASAALRALVPTNPRAYAYAGALIADSLKGRVYVRVVDPGAAYAHWQWDPNRTGAPQNGVRFVLFQYDTTTNSFSTTEAGYLDVIDSSSNPTNRIVANLLTPGANGRTVLHTRYAVGGTQSTSTDTLTGTITNEQGKSVSYSMISNETGVGDGSRRTETINAQLSDNSMSMSASLVDGALTASDKQQLTGTIGSTTITLSANTVQEPGTTNYDVSDTTHIAVNGNNIGYAVPTGADQAMSLAFYNADGSQMPTAEVDALKKFLGTTDQLIGTVFVGYTVLFWLYMIGAGF